MCIRDRRGQPQQRRRILLREGVVEMVGSIRPKETQDLVGLRPHQDSVPRFGAARVVPGLQGLHDGMGGLLEAAV
eukprot:12260091-Alexandrium_andersonii.AAC.1